MAFCLSLGEPRVPNPDDYPEEDREFNRYTLLGEYDSLFVALLKQKCAEDSVNFDRLPDYFRAHLNRGVGLLQQRVRNLNDLALLVASQNATAPRPNGILT
jgi:DNA sulfur modification protein DndE